MDFSLNEEQEMWRNIVHDFVAREVKPKAREVDEKPPNWMSRKNSTGRPSVKWGPWVSSV